jgi:hypothetical protein
MVDTTGAEDGWTRKMEVMTLKDPTLEKFSSWEFDNSIS